MIDETILKYNCLDSAVTKDIEEQIWGELESEGYNWTYDFTIRCLQPFLYIMTRGMLVDTDRLSVLKKETESRLKVLEENLNELCGGPMNALSPKQCQQYFYIKKGIKPFTKTNSKGKQTITTDDRAMQRLAIGTANRAPMPEAKLVQEIRGLNKLLGTYLEIEFDDDGRFRTSINPRGTPTGRISTSKTIFETGMNMQNLPPAFKSFLIPDPGFIIIEPDLAGAEWVVVAYLTGDANMIKVVEENKDPHIFTGHLMFNLPEELIVHESKLIGHSTDPFEIERVREKFPQLKNNKLIPRNMSIRQAAKKANHGLNYDEGYRTFALMNEMVESDAKRLVELYHESYPGIRIWYEKVKNQLQKDRTLFNCFGRKRKFLDAIGDKLYKAAYAHIPQSTVSDNLNLGLCEIYEDQSDLMKDVQILLQIHDSMPNQYPISDVEKLADCIIKQKEYLSIEMEYGGRKFTLGVDVKAGFNLGHDGMTDLKNLNNRELLIKELSDIIEKWQEN